MSSTARSWSGSPGRRPGHSPRVRSGSPARSGSPGTPGPCREIQRTKCRLESRLAALPRAVRTLERAFHDRAVLPRPVQKEVSQRPRLRVGSFRLGIEPTRRKADQVLHGVAFPPAFPGPARSSGSRSGPCRSASARCDGRRSRNRGQAPRSTRWGDRAGCGGSTGESPRAHRAHHGSRSGRFQMSSWRSSGCRPRRRSRATRPAHPCSR